MTEGGEPLTALELSCLPVFPLSSVVFFPGSILPLHLFEPRYRAMMRDCIERGPMVMAIALLQPGWEDGYEGRPPIEPVCGAGRILEHRLRSDGCFDLLLEGVCRVKVEELDPQGRPYRVARAEVLPDRITHSEPVEALRATVFRYASSLASAIRLQYPQFELGADSETDPSLLADRLADRLVSDVAQRQRLLEERDVKVRLALVEDALLELMARIPTSDGNTLH